MNLKSIIESILFLQGEPLAVASIVKFAGAPKREVLTALGELAEEYRERGIVLMVNGEEWQFATNPKNKSAVDKLVTTELSGELSRAALEVLAIVAYKGPVSQTTIAYIRGTDSSASVRTLLLRGLVLREENSKDRRSYLYRISTAALKLLGVTSPAQLLAYPALAQTPVEPPPEQT